MAPPSYEIVPISVICFSIDIIPHGTGTVRKVQCNSLAFEFPVPVRNFHIAVKYMYLLRTEVRAACAVYARSGKFKMYIYITCF